MPNNTNQRTCITAAPSQRREKSPKVPGAQGARILGAAFVRSAENARLAILFMVVLAGCGSNRTTPVRSEKTPDQEPSLAVSVTPDRPKSYADVRVSVTASDDQGLGEVSYTIPELDMGRTTTLSQVEGKPTTTFSETVELVPQLVSEADAAKLGDSLTVMVTVCDIPSRQKSSVSKVVRIVRN